MESSDNLANVAQNKINELIGSQNKAYSHDMTFQHPTNVGYQYSSSDDQSYRINGSPHWHVNSGGCYVQPPKWDNTGSDISIGGVDWSQQIARLAEDPAKQKEDQMLKQMPMEMTIERMKRCAGCTFACIDLGQEKLIHHVLATNVTCLFMVIVLSSSLQNKQRQSLQQKELMMERNNVCH